VEHDAQLVGSSLVVMESDVKQAGNQGASTSVVGVLQE